MPIGSGRRRSFAQPRGIAGAGRCVVSRVELIEQYRTAQLMMEVGRPVDAARIFERVMAAESDNSDVRLRLALAYFASAQLTKAEEHLRALVAQEPSNDYAHHVLGRTLERQSRTAEALTHLRLADAMAQVPEYRTAVERVAALAGAERSGGPLT
jgi:predicted Zn-dependent protease